jgi:hypothetical protein
VSWGWRAVWRISPVPRRLAFNLATDEAPAWLPDGSGIIYSYQTRITHPNPCTHSSLVTTCACRGNTFPVSTACTSGSKSAHRSESTVSR